MKEYVVKEAGCCMRYQDLPGEGTGTYRISQFSEQEYLETGYRMLLQEYRSSGNTRWAAAIADCLGEGGQP